MTELLAPVHAAQSSRSLRCSGCGYGVSVRLAPAACPMCRGTEWHEDTRLGANLLVDELRSLTRTHVGALDRS